MSEQNNKKVTMAKDTVIYMIAKLIEGVVGVLTISAMSYIYLPSAVGKYSTLNIAVTTVAMVCIQWLIQSVLRYVNKYILEKREQDFFSTVFISWLKVNLQVIFVFSLVILVLKFIQNEFIINFFKEYPVSLLISGLFMFFSYNTFQLLIALLAGVRKAKVNLLLSVINVTGKLILIVVLNKIFPTNIIWIFVSYGTLDLITSIIGVYKLDISKYISLKNNSPEILSTLKVYGLPLMGNMIATSILNKSDIYIITWFLGDFSAGVYQTNYSIIASAFTLLSTGAMRGSYPTILRAWNEGKTELTEKLISEAVRMFLIVSIPAVFGIFALSDFIAISLFEENYFSGHSIMGFVALGMLFLGMTEYAIKPWELKAKTKSILKRSLFCGILNIVLNVILVPYFSFEICAINTFVAFFIYFLMAKLSTRKYIAWTLKKSVYFKIIFSSAIMFVVILILKSLFEANLFSLALLVMIGVFTYFTTLYLTGEIKQELKSIINKFKK